MRSSDDAASPNFAADWNARLAQAEEVLKKDPKDPAAQLAAVQILIEMRQFVPAYTKLEGVVESNSDRPDVLLQCIPSLINVKRFTRAREVAERALALESDGITRARLLIQYGRALFFLDKDQEAEAVLREGISLAPLQPDGYIQLGHLLSTLGQFPEAAQNLSEALRIDPLRVNALLLLLRMKGVRLDDGIVKCVLEVEARIKELPQQWLVTAYYCLGEYYDRTGQVDRAFHYFDKGASFHRKQYSYSLKIERAFVARTTTLFSTTNLERQRIGGSGAETTPIFVLGMPRSGTTLVEQILSSHAEVVGAGEIRYLEEALKQLRSEGSSGRLARAPIQEQLEKCAKQYLYAMTSYLNVHRTSDAQHCVVDKMPLNYRRIGLIWMALPSAKVVHVRRHPLDTCFSIFTTLFRKNMLGWSYDLHTLGQYYRLYWELMAHWRSTLPPKSIYEIFYEKLIADPEAEMRRLLDYLDLPWDSRCLSFQDTSRSVRTSSLYQVRQPLYQSGVGRANKYRAHLGPLIEELAPMIGEYEAELC